MKLDFDDVDILDIDCVVVYYYVGFNSLNVVEFDWMCFDMVMVEFIWVIDVGSVTFVLDMLELV